jgi:threonine synthase
MIDTQSNVTDLVCVECQAHYREGEIPYTCPECGVNGILDVQYDYERLVGWKERLAASSELSMWRYMELLPVTGRKGLPPLQVGWTPIYDCPRLASRYGLGELRIKDEGRGPTGSLKDRASALGTVKARELGFDTLACASTGNAASSLAGFCAAQGLESIIFVPSYALEAKLAQLRAFGAVVLLIRSTYEEAYDLCQKSVESFGWYNRNCAVNPYLIEGKKTCGLEIAEQCANRSPDVVAVSVGDGCTIAGIWKGMKEMKQLGVWDRTPRLLGVQPEGASAIVKAHASGTLTLEKRQAHSIADSISVAEPHNWRKAMNAVAESGGAWIAVSDEAILDACKEMSVTTGVFAEPAGAAAFAGILRAREQGIVSGSDSILHVVTGNGLKDIKSATARAPEPHVIEPSLDEVREAIISHQSSVASHQNET